MESDTASSVAPDPLIVATSRSKLISTPLRRGLRKRCPHCGEGPLFSGWPQFERCSICGLVFVRNPGDIWPSPSSVIGCQEGPNALTLGDEITVTIVPAIDGKSPVGLLSAITYKDGHVVRFRSPDE